MDHVIVSNKLHSNPLSLQLKAIGSRTIRERLSEAVTLRQKKNKKIINKVLLEEVEKEDKQVQKEDEMVISSTMNSKWKSINTGDGPHNWSSVLNGGGGFQNGDGFQDQPLDFSSKTKKRRFSSSSSSEAEAATTKHGASSKYEMRHVVDDVVVKVKTKEEMISTKSLVKPSMVLSSVEEAQKIRLKEQYLQLLRPEGSHHSYSSNSTGNFFPIKRQPNEQLDVTPNVPIPPSGIDGMSQFGGLPLGFESSPGLFYEGNHHTRVARPFKTYVRDAFNSTSASTGRPTLPMGYYGLPSQHSLMSMHFPTAPPSDRSSIDSFSNCLADRTYSTESYAEFRRQVLSLHQTMNGSTKRSLDSVQSFSPHPRPTAQYMHNPRSDHHNHIESSDQNFASSSPLLNPASSPSSFSSSVSPSSSPRCNKKTNPVTTSSGMSGDGGPESTITRNVVCPSPTSSCTSSLDSKVHNLVQTTNTFASSGSFSDSVHLHRSMNGSTSSTSSVDGVGNGDVPCKRRGRSLPEELKDEAYWERRRKNNEAAKRSRDARRAKEDEIAIRAAFLEQENLKLRVEVASLKSETAKLRCLLYNS